MSWHLIKLLTTNKWIIQFEPYCKDHELNQFFIDYMNLLKFSTSPIIIIFDMQKLTVPSISQLTKQIIFIQKMKILHKEKLQHFFLIINTKIVHDLVDWVFKITPPVVPYKIVNCFEEIMFDKN